MSRLQNVKQAVRPALKARLMLSSPPGAGKTRSALIVATVFADGGPILVIDTEKESALTYADDFEFQHLAWQPPYDPRELTQILKEASTEYAVIVADSASHFWRGTGGTLDIAGGKYTGWKAARPAQEDLVDAILDSRTHVILCGRSKIEHVQEFNDKTGKFEVHKLGLAVQQDDTLEYELNIAAELDMEHRLVVSKSRCITVPVGATFQPGHAEDFAHIYIEWLTGGEPAASQTVVDRLVARMNALGAEQRAAVKQEFVARFGRPEHLRESQVVAAVELVADWEATPDTTPPDDGGGAPPPDGGDDLPDGGGPPYADPGEGEGVVDPVRAEPSPTPEPDQQSDQAISVRDVAILAQKVFRADYDATERGDKTHAVDRLRHALAWTVTKGAMVTSKDLTPMDLHRVWAWLCRLESGVDTYTADAAGVTFRAGSTGRKITVAFADLERTEAA